VADRGETFLEVTASCVVAGDHTTAAAAPHVRGAIPGQRAAAASSTSCRDIISMDAGS